MKCGTAYFQALIASVILGQNESQYEEQDSFRLKSGSHRHKLGQDGPTKVNKVRNSGRTGQIFAVCTPEKVQATPESRYPVVSIRILNFVDLCWPSYPVLWRCELCLTYLHILQGDVRTDIFHDACARDVQDQLIVIQ